MSKQDIAKFCTDLIVRRGPLTLDELAGPVSAAGLTKARSPQTSIKAALGQSAAVVRLPDDRFDAVRRILDGSVLTHRVRSATAGRSVLFAGQELGLLDDLLSAGPVPLAGGGAVRRSDGDVEGFVGSPGWLPDVPAGALVAVRFSGGGLRVEPVDTASEVLTERAERVRDVVAKHVGVVEPPPARWRSYPAYGYDDWPDYGQTRATWRGAFTRAVLHALVECPDLLAEPVPPLDEVLRLPELSWRDLWTGRARDGISGSPTTCSLTLHGVPTGLRAALEERAKLSGVPVGELTVLQLAAATFRWEDPCRHDVEQAFVDRYARDQRNAAQRRYDELAYESAYDALEAFEPDPFGDPALESPDLDGVLSQGRSSS